MNLSVVLPTYNRRALVPFCIHSILLQLEPEDELLILIDGEHDPSYAFVASLAETDPRVRITYPGYRAKAFEIYRMLFERAQNDCIIMVHDDEIYHSQLIAKARRGFTEMPEVVFQLAGQLQVLISDCVQSFVNISYAKDAVLEGRDWVAGVLDSGMIFNCSCLVFRRNPEALKVLTRDQLSADNLFAIVQAAAGKVTQGSYISSTWLLHAANTSRRDYLQAGHRPLWRGLEELRQQPGYGFLSESAIQSQRNIARRAYLWNAFAAAAVDGKRDAFLQCLRYAAEASPRAFSPKFLRIFAMQPLWFLFCKAAKVSKFIFRIAKKSKSVPGLDTAAMAALLQQPETFVKDYLAAANAR